MRQWAPHTNPGELVQVLSQAIPRLGEPRFEQALLASLYPVLPAASCAVYRTGPLCQPAFLMSASHGVPDTTRDCWRAYLSGPYRSDSTLQLAPPLGIQVRHITAQEVLPEHRAKVYEAHGMVERLSVLEPQGRGALFAINFYRHQHQRPFSDAQIGALAELAPALLALAHKHLLLRGAAAPALPDISAPLALQRDAGFAAQVRQVQQLHPALSLREAEVCAGILQGLTLDGIASQLGLRLPTVKTYRSRAFARMGIQFRNQLFARALEARMDGF
ncbi:LuxR C-terminal-related transcriptional regulator [Rhodoferax sp.]|uniref:helix-turn-helix transcriptional regulator n=1 Tax=Rhodoferax sp. TaxID=50421 RepID=UPI00374CE7BB